MQRACSYCFFFFKQKTAYEMRISDWSSDVCSSDLPGLRRIMLPPRWVGHPLRKEHAARATEFDPFVLDQMRQDLDQEALLFKPEDWGMKKGTDNEDFMFLNLGPNHPSAHGAFRIVLQQIGRASVRERVVQYG